MIFDNKTFSEEYSLYKNYLELFSALSYLFSEAETPYIHYRIMENIFCEAFKANNLSRTDTAFDASKIINGIKYGVGLKTFTANVNKNGVSKIKQEKIAEFNKESINFSGLSIKQMTLKIAELRNARIESAMLEYGIDKSLYHCAIRYHENDIEKSGKILLKEFSYEPINLENIICTDENYKPISDIKSAEYPIENLFFIDGKNQYSFNRSKSTLLKRFDTSLENGIIIPVKKIENPYEELMNWFSEMRFKEHDLVGINHVILPLYSTRSGSTKEKEVPEKSGLNQWRAGGRKRKFGEMYIPVPSFIHHYCKGFFPNKDKKFILITPNNKEISVKLCQDGSKALMSDPNNALSEWFHPLLMKDNNESAITYKDLARINKDAVRIEKVSEGKYKFSLATVGSWEIFKKDIEKKNNKT
jgi:hypothetical protein